MLDRMEQDQYIALVQSALQRAQQNQAQAEVNFLYETGFAVTTRGGDVETLEQSQEKGLSITVYKDQRTGSASTVDLSEAAINNTVEKACTIASYASQDPYGGLADKELLADHYPDLDLYHPWSITPADAIQLAIRCDKTARQQDKRLTSAEGVTVTTQDYFRVFANSHGFLGHYLASEHSLSCSMVAEEDNQKQREYEYTLARKAEWLDDADDIGKRAAEKALQRLGARKLPTQRCPVIFQSDVAAGLIGTLIAAISGKSQYRRATFLLNQIDQVILPTFVNIYQQPHLLNGLGSAPFDLDGVRTYDQHYVKEGRLVSYVLGTYSSRKLGLKSTGNSGGVYNLTLTHQELSLQQLLKKMDKGLLVTDLMGQGVDLITGNYSRAAVGFWVEQGEIQFPVEEVTIAGNLKEMLRGIEAIGNDIDHRKNIRTGSILINEMMVAGE